MVEERWSTGKDERVSDEIGAIERETREEERERDGKETINPTGGMAKARQRQGKG